MEVIEKSVVRDRKARRKPLYRNEKVLVLQRNKPNYQCATFQELTLTGSQLPHECMHSMDTAILTIPTTLDYY